MTDTKLYLRLLLALSVANAVAQLEPQEDALNKPRPTSPPSPVMSLFRDQAAKQHRQLPPTTTTTLPPTIVAQTTANLLVASPQVTKVNQVPTTTTSTQAPETTTTPAATTGRAPAVQLLVAATTKICQFKSKAYALGQKWNDDCVQTCECVLGADASPVIACRDRCPVYKDMLGDNCKSVRSATDACCLEWICSADGKQVPTTTTSLINTERGQVNVSTTEIKFSSPAPTTTAAQTTVQAPTTTQQAIASPTTTLQPVPTQSPVATTYPAQVSTFTAPPGARDAKQTSQAGAREPRDFVGPAVVAQPPPSTELPAISALDANNDRADPLTTDLCIVGDVSNIEAISGYRVNDTWEDECGSVCRCAFRLKREYSFDDWRIEPTLNVKEGSEQTEIVCSIAPQCRSPNLKWPKPSAECQLPKWLSTNPRDKCSCPQLACAEKSQPARPQPPITTTTIAPTQPKPSGCWSKQHNGRWLNINETFNDECHSTCQCMPDGQIRCQPLACPSERQPNDECSEWTLNSQFRPNSSLGACCADFVCSKKTCTLLNKVFAHGESIPNEIQPKQTDTSECGQECHCNNGEVSCTPVCLGSTEKPDDFKCIGGQGSLIKDPNECCPRWVCYITEDYALKKFTVSPINATSVEVNYVLPSFAIGHMGRAELNYTSLPVDESDSTERPPENVRWIRKSNIKTPDGYFHVESIKYIVNNLKPDHRYWFHLKVHFQGQDVMPPLDEALESEVQQVVLPPLTIIEHDEVASSTTTTTTTTTTTQVPPTRILHPNTSSSHQTRLISWSTATTARPTTTSTTQVPTTATSTAATTTTTTTQQPSSVFMVSTSAASASPAAPTSSSTTTASTSLSTAAHLSEESATQGSKTAQQQQPTNVIKQDVSTSENQSVARETPCSKMIEENRIDFRPLSFSEALTDQLHNSINGSLQRHAWHLLFCCLIMTVLFTIVLIMYLKKTLRVIAPISSQAGYDNPGFPPTFKSTNYLAHQKHSFLGVDENSQNYNNDNILAKQKNIEVDQTSPLHHHQMNDIHHYNGRQHLI